METLNEITVLENPILSESVELDDFLKAMQIVQNKLFNDWKAALC